jgi:hypothetical protein
MVYFWSGGDNDNGYDDGDGDYNDGDDGLLFSYHLGWKNPQWWTD